MKNQKRPFFGRAMNNGIIFCSNLLPSISCKTFYNSNGNINFAIVSTKLKDTSLLSSKYDFLLNRKNTYGILYIIAISLILLSIGFELFHLAFAIAYFFIFASVDLYDFIIVAHSMQSKNGCSRNVGKYHSAEHMVVSAYYNLGRVPTLKEVKNYSRFTIDCGSQRTIVRIVKITLFSLIISIFPLVDIIVFFILFGCVSILCIVPKSMNWCKIFQCFITVPPTEKELLLAITALKNYQYMENKIKSEIRRI